MTGLDRQILALLDEAASWSGSRHLRLWKKKLIRRRFRIAVFGLVNRGKSALINALMGSPLLTTGPLNGVTQKTQVVGWKTFGGRRPIRVEWVDTPGLEEVAGEARSQLAWGAAVQADLILFVISGDLSQVEYEALLALRRLGKPLFLVFNKIDLYPTCDRELIYAQLTHPDLRCWVNPEQIFLVSAAPPPRRVRQVWLDGRTTEVWEFPPPQVETLRHQLREVITQDGERLMCIAVLRGLDRWQRQWVKGYLAQGGPSIWGWMGFKAVLWTLLPMVDGLISLLGDLGWVWQHHKTYRLPLTRRLWGSLGEVIVIHWVVAAAAHLLWAGGWWWGGESIYIGLAWWGSRHIRERVRDHVREFGWWQDRDPQSLLRQLGSEMELTHGSP